MTKSENSVSETSKQRANMRGGFMRRIYWAICRVASPKNEFTTIFWISVQIRQCRCLSGGKDII
jgi:hypothetical protein